MNRKPLHVCLLGASFRVGNGVAALTAGAIQSILHACPDAEISILDYGKEGGPTRLAWHGKSAAIQLVNIRFSKKFYLRNNIARLLITSLILRIVPTAVRQTIARRNPSLQHVEESDLIASIAGGDSFSDIYGLSRFLYVSLPQLLAIWMGKRLVVLPQTLGPFKGRLSRSIARYILRRADSVYSRDREGLETVAELLGKGSGEAKVRFCNDVAFVLETADPSHVELLGLPAEAAGASCRVGLNVSGLLNMGGYNRRNMFGLRIDYDELIRDIVQLLIEGNGATVVLIPHVFGFGPEGDSRACELVYTALKSRYEGRLGLISGDYNQSEIKSIIGQCDFFIGSRMHACIAAVSQCVPTVSIAYSDKFTGVMDTLESDLPVADARTMDEAEILNLVSQAFKRRNAIRRQLEQKIPVVRKRVLGLFDEVAVAGDIFHSAANAVAVDADEKV